MQGNAILIRVLYRLLRPPLFPKERANRSLCKLWRKDYYYAVQLPPVSNREC